MNKHLVMLFMLIGSAIGGYFPVLFGADAFSFVSVLATFIGGALGIWLAFRMFN
jgi:hypothetical protein